MPARRQLSFDDLGTPLAEATLVVVDLETTGTDPVADAITEIGAVKVRGCEVLGEFRTFVDPERPIPAFIASLTGITDAAVQGAPTIRTVLPMFLDFVGPEAALVAHNARFDIGFLRARAAECAVTWPSPAVLDTLALARAVFRRDEVRDHKLSTLAAHVGASVSPDHRALSDARATVDVLHAIIERLGPAGAATLEDITSAHRRAKPVQLRKKHLAAEVPPVPGVYQFLDAAGAVLYVGTSRNVRSRVRTYFTAGETRRAVLDMLPRAESVHVIECATATEAAVRELRLIAREKPPSNRRGLRPEVAHWLRLGPAGEGLRGARIARDEADGSARSARSPPGTTSSRCGACSPMPCWGAARPSSGARPGRRRRRQATAPRCGRRWSPIPAPSWTTSPRACASTSRPAGTRTPSGCVGSRGPIWTPPAAPHVCERSRRCRCSSRPVRAGRR